MLDENAVCWEHGGSSWVVDVWERVNWFWSKWVVLWNDGSWLMSKLGLTISYKLSLSGGQIWLSGNWIWCGMWVLIEVEFRNVDWVAIWGGHSHGLGC